MKQFDFDVLVVGAGHAGCEAAHAAARMGVSVGLVTFRRSDIGVMSCNPAIGGLGKGHLVREIDAMGGLMGRVADRAAIQFRLLNRKKGPAVQGPRVQADRQIYQREMSREILATSNLRVLEGEVVDLVVSEGQVVGVALADGGKIMSDQVVMTSGTFLGGLMHIGTEKFSGGRFGAAAAGRLADRIRALPIKIGRLKTGTPPRLRQNSIRWDGLERQDGDDDPVFLSFSSNVPALPQRPCFITHTNDRTHDIIRANLEYSAMYGGRIDGIGPRYCPSIEDKIVRFPQKDSHQVFLEPEGLTSDLIYPNGISTSLPATVQSEYVRSIPGLEDAEIVQHGYAIEYDYVSPTTLEPTLELRCMPGLFLAGQINGTTGYEEAAAQGLVAGLNSALRNLSRDPIVFSRTDSYIGVMVDDLTSTGVTEPYRMFTSRAEYRLSLRADNADSRLSKKALEIGCLSEDQIAAFRAKEGSLAACRKTLSEASLSSRALVDRGVPVGVNSNNRTAYEALGAFCLSGETLSALVRGVDEFDDEVVAQIRREATYAPYVERQAGEVAAVRKSETIAIPEDFDYEAVGSLSNEARDRLATYRPKTIAQAEKLEGVTPAAILALLSGIQRSRRALAS